MRTPIITKARMNRLANTVVMSWLLGAESCSDSRLMCRRIIRSYDPVVIMRFTRKLGGGLWAKCPMNHAQPDMARSGAKWVQQRSADLLLTGGRPSISECLLAMNAS